jgi:hypothetical protein
MNKNILSNSSFFKKKKNMNGINKKQSKMVFIFKTLSKTKKEHSYLLKVVEFCFAGF